MPKDKGPQPVNVDETLGTDHCGFPVRYEASGETKVTKLPHGDRLYENPNLRVTLTNKETGKRVTYVATGTLRTTKLKGGDLQFVTTGQTVISSPNIGILVLNGGFTFVEDKDGNFSQPKGDGSIIDACKELA